MLSKGQQILALAVVDPKELGQLAKRLSMHASAHMLCGYSDDQGIVPDTATAAVLLEALADFLEGALGDDRTDKD